MTDINMPFLDGLSFTDRLIGVSPLTKVLIISGYDDFAYARRERFLMRLIEGKLDREAADTLEFLSVS
jgi:two-component SAPR family response regulator